VRLVAPLLERAADPDLSLPWTVLEGHMHGWREMLHMDERCSAVNLLPDLWPEQSWALPLAPLSGTAGAAQVLSHLHSVLSMPCMPLVTCAQ
jgi:hypothetical protein